MAFKIDAAVKEFVLANAVSVTENGRSVLLLFLDTKETRWFYKSDVFPVNGRMYWISKALAEGLPTVELEAEFDLPPPADGEVFFDGEVAHVTAPYRHQALAARKMMTLKRGALFMEMGTGKTKVALDVAQTRYDNGLIDGLLYLCPVSVKDHVKGQAERHGTSLPLLTLGIESLSHGLKAYAEALSFMENRRTMLVLDEAHLCKNTGAIRSSRVAELSSKCEYAMALTGTPLTQSPGDLFGIFNALDPSCRLMGYSSQGKFDNAHIVKDGSRIVGYTNLDAIAKRIAPAVFQVQKKDCLDLPEKTYEKRTTTPNAQERLAYSELKSEFAEAQKTGRELLMMGLMNMLHQTTGGFCVKRPFDNPEPSKIEELKKIMRELEGQKTVVWCEYANEVDAICELFDGAVRFDGRIGEKERAANLARWKSGGDANVLVANPQSGGVGIDLVEANVCIFYSTGFKYSARLQAEDRLHRIGQKRSVHYVDLVSTFGIEKLVHQCLQRKESLAQYVKRAIKEELEIEV